MLGLSEDHEAKKCFYRYFFAMLCFICLGVGMWTNSHHGFAGALICGAFSRTAARKKWRNPKFIQRIFPHFDYEK